jgi:hypothetical protein
MNDINVCCLHFFVAEALGECNYRVYYEYCSGTWQLNPRIWETVQDRSFLMWVDKFLH